MSQHAHDPQTPTAPVGEARIVVRQFNSRIWSCWTEGEGRGFEWGAALAALDYYSEAHTAGSPPVFYLNVHAVRELRRVATALGVRVHGFVPGVGA